MFWNPEGLLTDPQSLNSYSYARNNPIMLSDPSGLTAGDILAGTFYGMGKFVVDTVVGLGKLALYASDPDPSKVISMLENIPKIPGAVAANAKSTYNTIKYGNDFERSEALAYNTAFLASFFVGGGEASEASKAAKIATAGNIAEEAGSLARMESILKPGGSWIGIRGSNSGIRVVNGGLSDAEIMFEQLTEGMTPVQKAGYNGMKAAESANGDFIGLRTIHGDSPTTAATIDINVNGMEKLKIKFNP